ncbi:hypothetical protein FRC11_012624, partial [Ceratobasidium sp. 423]
MSRSKSEGEQKGRKYCPWCTGEFKSPSSLGSSPSSSDDESTTSDTSTLQSWVSSRSSASHYHCQLRSFLQLLLRSEPAQKCQWPIDCSPEGSSVHHPPRIIYVRDVGLATSWARHVVRILTECVPFALLAPPRPIAVVYGLTPEQPLTYVNASTRFPFGLSEFSLSTNSLATEESITTDDSLVPGTEGSHANKLRDERLLARVAKWRANTLILDELKTLRLHACHIGGPDNSNLANTSHVRSMRSSIIMPKVRDLNMELAYREARRQAVNELRLRIAFGLTGVDLTSEPMTLSAIPGMGSMISQWRQGIINPSVISNVIDRTLACLPRIVVRGEQKSSVSWATLCSAWTNHQCYQDQCLGLIHKFMALPDPAHTRTDPLVQRVENLLDAGERDLLRCLVNPTQVTTTFAQVHHPTVVERISTLVSLPLRHPALFKSGFLSNHSLGGVLLFGPPGTGKTLIAQAVAKESGARMLAIKPSDILEACNGNSEKVISNLFKLARRLQPCLIFMDEIDGILGARIYQSESNSGHWYASILTQFMQEMDGLVTSDVLVIGATNRPFALDEAIIRRLPHRVMVDLPKRRARREILKILLREELLAADVNLRDIARETKQFSGSDLKEALCVSAAMAAAKEDLKLPWKTSVDSRECPPESQSKCGQTNLGVRDSRQPPVSRTSQLLSDGQLRAKDVHNASQVDIPNVISSSPPPPTLPPEKCLMEGTPPCGDTTTSPLSNNSGRILFNRHFRIALGEIKATSYESSQALQELRHW